MQERIAAEAAARQAAAQERAAKAAAAEKIRQTNRSKPGGSADNLARILEERGYTPESFAALEKSKAEQVWRSVGQEHRKGYDPHADTRALALERLAARKAAATPAEFAAGLQDALKRNPKALKIAQELAKELGQ
jgi:hypothetical protein